MIADNTTWLLVVLSVMSGGRVDKNGKIELRRMMQALRTLHCVATLPEVEAVCRVLVCYDESNPSLLYYNDFLQPLKDYFGPPPTRPLDKPAQPESERRDKPREDLKDNQFDREDEKDMLGNPDQPSPSSPPVPESEPRNREDNRDSPRGEDNKLPEVPEQDRLEESIPDLDESWCNGEFQLVINRCHNCKSHETYTRHSEDVWNSDYGIEIHRHVQPDRRRAEEGLPDDGAGGQLREGPLHGRL